MGYFQHSAESFLYMERMARESQRQNKSYLQNWGILSNFKVFLSYINGTFWQIFFIISHHSLLHTYICLSQPQRIWSKLTLYTHTHVPIFTKVCGKTFQLKMWITIFRRFMSIFWAVVQSKTYRNCRKLTCSSKRLSKDCENCHT